MFTHSLRALGFAVLFALTAGPAAAQDALVVADGGKTKAVVVVDAKAGKWEKRAATDLAKYIGLMSGATPPVVNPAVPAAADAPLIIVGSAALKADPTLADALAKVGKKEPV